MALAGTVWRPIGPSPLNQSGRQDNGLVTAVAVNPNNGNVVYIGTAGGGVWRTPDGGANWVPIFDRQIVARHRRAEGIAIDPSDTSTLYIGTSGRVHRQVPAGLTSRSTAAPAVFGSGSGYPAGNTGNASQFTQDINVISSIQPTRRRYTWLRRRVFRSLMGGRTGRSGPPLRGCSLARARSDVAGRGARAVHRHQRTRRVSSTDGGLNWTRILGGAAPRGGRRARRDPRRGVRKGHRRLAPPTSPPNPTASRSSTCRWREPAGRLTRSDVFLSSDQGATWTQQVQRHRAPCRPIRRAATASTWRSIQARRATARTTSSTVGTVGQARSTDAGQFHGLTGLHADTHTWAFFRPPGGGAVDVYSGNDGGIAVRPTARPGPRSIPVASRRRCSTTSR